MTSLNGYGWGINFRGVRTSRSGTMSSGIVYTGQEIPYGAFVTRAADGYVKAQVTNVPLNYIGVANDDIRKHPVDGFYEAGSKVPIIVNGSANVWLLGGATVDTGDFVRFPATLGAGTESLGIITSEGTPTTRTAYSVGHVIDAADSGVATYTQVATAISGSTVTIDSAADLTALSLEEGDYIVIDSDAAAEVNKVLDPAATSATFTTVKTPLASHTTNKAVYKLVQIEVMML